MIYSKHRRLQRRLNIGDIRYCTEIIHHKANRTTMLTTTGKHGDFFTSWTFFAICNKSCITSYTYSARKLGHWKEIWLARTGKPHTRWLLLLHTYFILAMSQQTPPPLYFE